LQSTPTKLPVLIYGEAKAVSSTKGSTMQIKKNSSKKRAANKQITKSEHKQTKIDDASNVDMEATLIKDTWQYLFQFLVGLTPLQKLHEVLKDSYVSLDNPHQSDSALR
jgi:hypothetical protein